MDCVSDTLLAMSGQGVGDTHLDCVRANLFRVSTKVFRGLVEAVFLPSDW